MGVTTYYSVGGEILGERAGATRRDYLRDALGSVTATKVTSETTLQNTYRYKPYGERLSKTGAADDPRFQWNGTSGYRETSISHSSSYVRARHYGHQEGRWTTVDPLWPWTASYDYARSMPTFLVDPSGLNPKMSTHCAFCSNPSGNFGLNIGRAFTALCDALKSNKDSTQRCIQSCSKRTGVPIDIGCFSKFCAQGEVICQDCANDNPMTCPAGCCEKSAMMPGPCAFTDCGKMKITLCCNNTTQNYLVRCGCLDPDPSRYGLINNCDSTTNAIFHELGHVCGTGSGCNDDSGTTPPFTQKQLDDFGKCVKFCLRW